MENLNLERVDDVLLIKTTGEITIEVTNAYRKAIEAAVADGPLSALVWDASAVPFIDSSGIGLIVSCNTRMQTANRPFYLYRPSPQVKRTLALVKLLEFFNVIEDETGLKAVIPQ